MNTESKITVHQSSLIDLKAELLRKQAEMEVKKANTASTVINKLRIKDRKESKKKKREKEEKERASDDGDIDNIKTLKKSKLMLEAKSRLYDKLTKTHTNMNPHFLVDFEHKTDDQEPVREVSDEEDYYSGNDSDDGWVEYTDGFGRSRKCLREDLPKMRKEDELLRKNVVRKHEEPEKEAHPPEEEKLYVEDRLPSKESEIDILRRKWEEQTSKIAEKDDIHYQDILFDEARTHGVGYYAFSQDDDERIKQQENLTKLRKETEAKQRESQSKREMKERIQKNKLKLARMRKRARAGLPAEESDNEDDSENVGPETDNKEEDKVQQKENNAQSGSSQLDSEKSINNDSLNNEDSITAFGELLEKQNKWYIMSQEEWVEKQRGERNKDFAPVYNNFQRGETLNSSSSKRTNFNSNVQSEDSDVIGPMPDAPEYTDIIGPMPPSADDSNVIGPSLPTSDNSDSVGSMTSTDTTSRMNLQNCNNGSLPAVNIEDQIEAGLKLLRQKFEKGHTEL